MFRPGATSSGRLQRLQIAPPPGGRFVVGSLVTLGGIAISPDGETFASVATVDGVTSLWVQPLGDPVARRIDGPSGPQHPFWSPDSKSIGYFAAGGLFRVDAAGGAPVLVTQTVWGYPLSGSWSEDGTIVFHDRNTTCLPSPSLAATRSNCSRAVRSRRCCLAEVSCIGSLMVQSLPRHSGTPRVASA